MKKKIVIYLSVIFLIVGIVFIFKFFKQEQHYNEVVSNHQKVKDSIKIKEETTEPKAQEVAEDLKDKYMSKLFDIRTLQERNPHVDSWMLIPDTKVDNYIMRDPGDYYYLWLDIDENYSDWGSAFRPDISKLDKEGATHLIFGHRGTRKDFMFNNLTKYSEDAQYSKEHEYLYIYYQDRVEKWKVWSFGHITDKSPIYQIPYSKGTKSYKELLKYIEGVADKVLYEIDENQEITILSTCEIETSEEARYFVAFTLEEIQNY